MPVRLVMLPLEMLICNQQSAGHTAKYVIFGHGARHGELMRIVNEENKEQSKQKRQKQGTQIRIGVNRLIQTKFVV